MKSYEEMIAEQEQVNRIWEGMITAMMCVMAFSVSFEITLMILGA